MNRETQLQQLRDKDKWDVLVIGGGATGLGVALDAVSRGLDVCLVEKYDFGKGTSSRSTKLIHGGVRYLEQGNVALVREALKERDYFLKTSKHISRVQPFIVPCYSWWRMIYYYIGLVLYDILSGKYSIGNTTLLKASTVKEKIPNISTHKLRGGIRYLDGQFDDTRLCIDLVKTIVKHGGTCINHAGVTDLVKKEGKVTGAIVKDKLTQESLTIKADVVVNAAGVYTDTINRMDVPDRKATIIPSRGSHLVLSDHFLGGGEAIMIPKTSDGRVLFLIPWNGKVVAGTTDVKTEKPELEPIATREEIDFILNNCKQYLDDEPQSNDILSTFAGLRPLAAPTEGSTSTKEISRGHKIHITDSGLVNIIGGKWTTYRKMGEDTLDKIAKQFSLSYATSTSKDIMIDGSDNKSETDTIHPSLPYTWQTIEYIINNEMVYTIEDIIARRTRCLLLDVDATASIIEGVGQRLQSHFGKSDEWLSSQLEYTKRLLDIYKY